MTSFRYAAALAAALLFAPSFAQAPALPPVEAFGRLPFVSQPHLSPDGKHFALIRSVNGRAAAAIYSTNPEPGAKPALVGSSEGVIENVVWAKNDRLIIIAKQGLTETFDQLRTWHRAFAVDLNGGNMVKLMYNLPSVGNNTSTADVLDVNLDDPDHILMGLYEFVVHNNGDYDTLLKKKNDTFKYDVIKVDVRTGKGEVLKSGDSTTIDWKTDGHGTPVVQIRRTDPPLRDHVLVQHGMSWSEIGAYDATGDKGAGILSLTEDGKGFVRWLWADPKVDYATLVRYDLEKGQESTLFAAPNFDVSDSIADEWTGRVIGARYITDRTVTTYFDPKRQALQRGIESAFPGLNVEIVSSDVSENDVILAVEGPRQPRAYFLLNRTTHQTQFISGRYPELKDTDLGEMKPYPYKARDGLDIAAYLTLPPGKAPKNLPLVVMPHGGPQSRDAIGFEWMAQFLANRGYAVLQPNFRGSFGYGHDFIQKASGQWGFKMQDDITDGVKKAIADGIVDPKRVCIAGGSYGGYAALAGATFTPGVYACAISISGISDLQLLMGTDIHNAGGLHSKEAQELLLMMGSDMNALLAASPVRHVERVNCPILLMHGKNDTTVDYVQSKMMNDALLSAHKPVEFITFEGEDHYMSLAETRVRVLREMERFLKQYIGN